MGNHLMKYTYITENTTVTEAIKNYAETKLSVLTTVFHNSV